MRLRRSLTFVQAIHPEMLANVVAGNTDCIVFDLEDGVVVSKKPENRVKTLECLLHMDCRGKERVVRVNGPDTPFYIDDMEQVIKPGLPDAIRLPKCESVEYVMQVSNDLDKIENEAGLTRNSIELILMIETPEGIMNTYAMATCTKRVTAVGIGMEDLTSAMGIKRRYHLNCLDLLYAKQKMILEAKAAHVQALDSTILFHGSPDYMYEDSVNEQQMGFDGRSCSARYAELVDSVNKAFSPSSEDVDWAKRLIAKYDECVAAGISNIYLDDKFVDVPVVAKARTILNLQEQIDKRRVLAEISK